MEYLLKASAVIVIFYTCYKICLQRDTFFEQNRWFLLTGIITAVFIPFIVIPIYIEQPTINLQNFVLTENINTSDANNNSIDLISILTNLYLLGIIIFSIKFILQLSSLISLLINNENKKIERFKFIKTNNDVSPFSFFNYIVYNPQQFNDTELQQIITHEKVHVSQHHTLDILLAQLACIVFWFNPFIWFYNKALKQNLEFIADQTAINFSTCKKSYQYTLLKTSMPTHQLALTNNFYNSLIKKRIVMLHKSKSKKINLLKFALIIPALALFLMSFNTKKVFVEKINLDTKTSVLKNLKKSSIEVVITKDFSDNDLENLKVKFKNEGITLKIKGIKRNSQGDITAIKIDVNSKSSSANYSIDTDEPINPIKISVDDSGKNISIGNGHLKKDHEMVFITKDGNIHETNNTDSDNNVFVISSDDDNSDDIEVKTIIIKDGDTSKITKKHKLKMINFNSDEDSTFLIKKGDKKVYKITAEYKGDGDHLTWTTDNDTDEIVHIAKDENAIKEHKIVAIKTVGNEPLYIVDGKEISKEEMNKIEPDTIESVSVLKGDSAAKKYGDKGKDGVVEITLKK
jgi:bla regulator protein blaR1